MRFGLPYRFRRALGLLMRHVKTCHACRQADAGQFIRARTWYAAWLIPPGNWYLSWLSTGVSMLPTSLWLDWECRMYAELSPLLAQRAGRRQLLLPRIPGETLAAILSAPTQELSRKIQAVRLAAAALIETHRHNVPWPDGISRPFSHGDATARNVLCDVTGGRATWIDFETLHDPCRTVAWRQADDLRALVWSAAESIGSDAFEALCAAILDVVSDTAVLRELAHVAASGRPNVYHLAQGTLSLSQHRRLCSILAVAIPQVRATRPGGRAESGGDGSVGAGGP